MIVYLIFVACIGLMVSYSLIRIPSLPAQNDLFRITNRLTAIVWVVICLTFTPGLVYLAYISISYLKEKFIIKTILVKGKSILQIIWHNYRKQPLNYLLITIVVLITLIKLNLIGTGFLAIYDEIRYCQSGKAVQNLLELKIRPAIRAIYFTQGRPVDAILKLIPITIQYITANIYKLNWYESDNSYPLFFYNFIIYCIIIYIHFKMSKLLLNDSFLSLISVLIFCTVTNSYLYLRHALPYDMSLLIFYLVIYKIVIYTNENSLSFKKSLITGICSFMGYLVYPGYFSLFMVSLFIFLFNNISKKDIIKRLYYSGYYVLGSILCLFICEKIARRVGTSYILDAKGLSKTITQG